MHQKHFSASQEHNYSHVFVSLLYTHKNNTTISKIISMQNLFKTDIKFKGIPLFVFPLSVSHISSYPIQAHYNVYVPELLTSKQRK